MPQFSIIPVNEFSLLISFGDAIHEDVHTQVMQAKTIIEANPFPGFVETVPAYTSLAIYYNPGKVEQSHETVSATVIGALQLLLNAANTNVTTTTNKTVEIPVCYEAEFAVDLVETAKHLKLSIQELIHIHSAKTYKVFMLGFTPGFPYMGTIDKRIITQRKQQPRLKIEPGSVAIAGSQTGIYPFATPGGWNIIGRTPLLLFDRNRSNPFLLKAGDEIKFKAIPKDEFEKYDTSDAPVRRSSTTVFSRPTKTSDEKKPTLHIEQCGFLTTLQDTGRTNYLQFGVSKGGAMDKYAAKLINTLIGNEEGEAVLELTQSPHRFVFATDAVIAFAGGGLQPDANGQLLPFLQPLFIAEGTVVECKQQLPGFRLYMSVAGGFEAEEFLQSNSTDLLIKAGGFQGRPLKKADVLLQKNKLSKLQQHLLQVLKAGAVVELLQHDEIKTNTIRVIKGIEWSYLQDDAAKQFSEQQLTVTSQSNRMGYRLKGETLTTNQQCEIISSPVTQGTVQLTPSGEMIILMADAQTVGGYPRIAQVCAADLSILAQKKPGDTIQFQIVSLQEAEELYLQQAKTLQQVKELLQSKFM